MKVLVAGIQLLTNTFTSHRTEYRDFTVLEDLSHLPEGIFPFATSMGIELVPGVFACAAPGGMLRHDVYNAFQGRIFESVKGKAFDAVLLRLHGCTVLEDYSSAEERLVRALRHYIGPMRPIVALFDSQGNLRNETMECLQYATTSRSTEPTELEQTFVRSLRALSLIYNKSLKTRIVHETLPLLIPPMAFSLVPSPVESILAEHDLERSGLCASVFSGYPWADLYHAGASVLVCGEAGDSRTSDLIDELTSSLWEQLKEYNGALPHSSLPTAFATLETASNTIFMCDSGDDISQGAQGNSTIVLHYALTHEIEGGMFLQFWDRDLVDLARSSGPGSLIPLQRLQIHDRMATVVDCVEAFEQYHVILECEGNHLVVSENRFAITEQEQITALQIQRDNFRYLVLKASRLPQGLTQQNTGLLLGTPGDTSLLTSKLRYKNLRRPIFPLDERCQRTRQT